MLAYVHYGALIYRLVVYKGCAEGGGGWFWGYFEVQNHGHNAAAARRRFSRKQ